VTVDIDASEFQASGIAVEEADMRRSEMPCAVRWAEWARQKSISSGAIDMRLAALICLLLRFPR